MENIKEKTKMKKIDVIKKAIVDNSRGNLENDIERYQNIVDYFEKNLDRIYPNRHYILDMLRSLPRKNKISLFYASVKDINQIINGKEQLNRLRYGLVKIVFKGFQKRVQSIQEEVENIQEEVEKLKCY